MNKFSKVIPLVNRVLVKKIIPEAKTASGIFLSEKSLEKDARYGVVVATGPGITRGDGKLIPVSVKVGDYVLLPEYSGTKVPMPEDVEYLIYKDTDLLAVLEDVKKV